MDPVADLCAKIRDRLREAGGTLLGPVLGNQLTSTDRAIYKQLGFQKLGDFVRQHLAEDVAVEPGGIFRLAATARSGEHARKPEGRPDESRPDTGDLFKAWKSPRSRYRLRVKPSTGEVRQVLEGSAPVEGEHELATPDNAFHIQLARRFVDEAVPPALQQRFRQEISETNPRWWEQWDQLFSTCAEDLPDGSRKWLTYRHNGFVDALKDALRMAGLQDEEVDSATKKILNSATSKAPALAAGKTPVAAHHESSLREIARQTIERLSDEELRRLWLPAGIFFDLMRTTR